MEADSDSGFPVVVRDSIDDEARPRIAGLAGGSMTMLLAVALCTGCSQPPLRTEQATIDSYLAAARAGNIEGLRAVMAYQPSGDPHSLIVGAQVPIACARIEEAALRQLTVEPDARPRLRQVAPAGLAADSAKLDMALIPLQDGAAVGRQLLQAGGSWYVLAEANDECNELL